MSQTIVTTSSDLTPESEMIEARGSPRLFAIPPTVRRYWLALKRSAASTMASSGSDRRRRIGSDATGASCAGRRVSKIEPNRRRFRRASGTVGLVGLPSTILLDQGRARRLAYCGLALVAGGAALALAVVWTNGSDALGKTLATVTVLALAAAQAAALTARRRQDDPASVRRLFAVSCALAAVAATMFAVALWGEIERDSYFRFLAAVAVLDLLVVALQPILVRARPAVGLHRLRLTVDGGETVELDVEAPDLAAAAAKAIRALADRLQRLEFGG